VQRPLCIETTHIQQVTDCQAAGFGCNLESSFLFICLNTSSIVRTLLFYLLPFFVVLIREMLTFRYLGYCFKDKLYVQLNYCKLLLTNQIIPLQENRNAFYIRTGWVAKRNLSPKEVRCYSLNKSSASFHFSFFRRRSAKPDSIPSSVKPHRRAQSMGAMAVERTPVPCSPP